MKQTFNRLKKTWNQEIRPRIVRSDGFLTKTDSLVNYVEVHSMGIGLMDGFMNPTEDYLERLEIVRRHHEEVDSQPHYFKKGFFLGRKAYFFSGLAVLALMTLVAAWVFKSI